MEFNATFIVSFISFIIFIVVMNLILYKPINDIIEKRQKFIGDNYDVANKNNEKSKSLLEDKQNQIKDAHKDAKEKFAFSQNEAKEKKSHTIDVAKKQSKVDIDERVIDFNNQSNSAKDALKNDVVALAQMICDKFIQSDEKVSANDEMIDKLMQG